MVQTEAKELFVSRDGDDTNPGTLTQPLATIAAAHKKARDFIPTMQTDIIIQLRSGIHHLALPLRLTAESDAGLHGRRVIYQAYNYGTDQQEQVTISGGKPVTDWQLYDADKNIWVAAIGDLTVRQLFVGNKRAPRATLTTVPDELTQTASGYDSNSTEPQNWGNPADLEFVYTGIYPWSEARIGVEAIQKADATRVIMKQPGFEWATSLYKSKIEDNEAKNSVSELGLSRPTSIENGLGFLIQPGTFVFDSSAPGRHRLYYIPQEDEDMQTAQVIAPVLETLIQGKGTENTPFRNVTFRGLTFAHVTWWQPSGPEGFVHYHGGTYYTGGGVQKIPLFENSWVTVPGASKLTPSALTFEHARAITFEDNRFIHFGTGGLEFMASCSFNTIIGNTFEDMSATAITIGSASPDRLPQQETKYNRIENNWLHHTGCEYHGASAILLVEGQHTTIAHNHIHDVPHSGIVAYGDNATRGTTIAHNLIVNSLSVLADGGGINLAGVQGTSYEDGAKVSGNVIRDVLTSYNYGLYTDYGTAWTTIEHNIICGAETPVVLDVTPPLRHVTFHGNFWDKQPYRSEKLPETVKVTENTILEGDRDTAIAATVTAKHIADHAGIEQTHPLRKGVK